MPIAQVLEFDPDEGIELAKATLLNQGYRLYESIWSDQPPLLTLLLASWLQHFGTQIMAARLLILGFATLLVSSFYGAVSLVLGVQTAVLSTLSLCLTLGFMRFSVSVMRGIPALALVMLAVYLLLWATQSERSSTAAPPAFPSLQKLLGIVASGICFGLSLQTKLYTLLIAPACIGHLWMGWSLQDWQKGLSGRRAVTGLLWLASCGVTFLAVGILSHSFALEQLVGAHFDREAQGALQREPSWLILLMFLAQDLDYSLLAGVGIWVLFKHKPQWPALPLIWLGSVLIGLANYQPLWDHYYPLIAVPVVWLASYGLTLSFSLFRRKQWYRQLRPLTLPSATAGLVIFAIALLPIKLTVLEVINHQFVQHSRENAVVIEQVRAFQSKTHWLFTDLPIAAFYANLKVPPEIAVFSTKRMKSGDLNTAKLLKILQTYQPEQVLLGRYPPLKVALEPYLKAHYIKQSEQATIAHYVLKSLM